MNDEHFTITPEPAIDGDGAVVRFRIAGELDMEARDPLRELLLDAVDSRTYAHIVIDLDQISFIDSEAINAIIDGYIAAQHAGITLRLQHANGIVRRVFDVIGFDHLF